MAIKSKTQKYILIISLVAGLVALLFLAAFYFSNPYASEGKQSTSNLDLPYGFVQSYSNNSYPN